MVDRWGKMSDAQLKIGSQRAGLTCANLDVVEASDVQLRGKGQGFLDVALDQAETARKELLEQNCKLREILLSAANQLQSVLHAVRLTAENENEEEVRRVRQGDIASLSLTSCSLHRLRSIRCSLATQSSQHWAHSAHCSHLYVAASLLGRRQW